MHRTRFGDMEPGLPEEYQEEERLGSLRDTHDDLISEGMTLISDAYLAPLIRATEEQGVACECVAPEGRNYVELLRLIRERRPDLAVLGAVGHGADPGSLLGSLTERTLIAGQGGDTLIVRRPWSFRNRPVVVGVDGSQNSYAALVRAIEIAAAFRTTVTAVAVYDPFFHSGVFSTIAGVLPAEAQNRFNFAAQEQLHDEIIDQGLERLYRANLERGARLAGSLDFPVETEVLAGKVSTQLLHYAAAVGAGLVVVGRFGLHRESESLIGSNTHTLARTSTTNVLVVEPPKTPVVLPETPAGQVPALTWTPEAEAILRRIPAFARGMAKTAIEEHVRDRGLDEVTESAVREVSRRFGMGG